MRDISVLLLVNRLSSVIKFRNLLFNLVSYKNLNLLISVLLNSIIINESNFLSIIFYESFMVKLSNKKIISSPILLYLFMSNRLFLFNPILKNNELFSSESLISSLKWEEREVKEFMNVNFLNKSDNRSLFLWSTIGGFPLKKSFPTSGLWSISIWYNSSIVFKKTSLS